MKARYFLLVVVLSLSLVGCSREYSVTLYNDDGTIYESYEEVKGDSILELPILEEEGQVFVGWTDGELNYYRNLRIRRDLELTAVFEDVTEVFDYDIDPETDEIYLKDYTGDAEYLKIPVMIDDNIIRKILFRAFENSQLIEVQIPKSIYHIQMESFKDSSKLERISFHGEYFGEEEQIIFGEEYDEILSNYSDACTVIEDNESSWVFSDGCPIKSVNSFESSVVQGFTVRTYFATVDIRYYDSLSTGLRIYSKAFSDLESLTTVEFPERFDFFNPGIFYNTPRLVDLRFNDNEVYDVIDSIVYNEEHDQLIYYPTGLEYESFEVPDFVNEIMTYAFLHNMYLETITIHETLEKLQSDSFHRMQRIESINVDSGNNYFYSTDGVLYNQNHTLIIYPNAKTDEHFNVPQITTTIAPYAFYGQQFLETITFSSNLTHLGSSSFMETEKLTVLDIPSSVTFIGYDLARNSSIETIIINRSLAEDGSLPGPQMMPYPNFPDVYVPDEAYNDYLSDFNWQFIGEYIHPISELETE